MTHRLLTAAVLTAALALVAAPAALAAVPFQSMNSAGPLRSIAIGNEGSCQIAHREDEALEFYPSTATPGDCGTFIATGGNLYAPDFENHDGTATSDLGAYTPFTPVRQSAPSGAGTAADPLRIVTVYNVGATGLQVTQTDSYVVGEERYRTDVLIVNNSGAPASGVVYRAGDCYLQSSDTGFGFVEGGSAPGCSLTANNQPQNRIEQFAPITPGARYMQAQYSQVWEHIGTKTPFPNSCRCTEDVDNGAGISWDFNLAPGQAATYSQLTVFSPSGFTAGNPAGRVPSSVFGSQGAISAPSNRRCVSRRRFRIRLRETRGVRYRRVVVTVNGRRVATRRGRRVTAPVDLRGLPRGRFTVRISVTTVTGRTIRGSRRYRTCVPRRRAR